jgi:hypothetical protein
MNIRIESPPQYKGDVYRFTSQFKRWLEAELNKLVKVSEAFIKSHGKGWMLFFGWNCGRRIKKPKLGGPYIDRKFKEKRWVIELPWFRFTSSDQNDYRSVVRVFLEQIADILAREKIDATKVEKSIDTLLNRLVSQAGMIEHDPHPYTFGTPDNPYGLRNGPAATTKPTAKARPKTTTKLPRKKLSKWIVPKDMQRRVDAEGGIWESERFNPILLTVASGTSYRGCEIPLSWQIEFDPSDERFNAANAKLAAAGCEPDGDGWSIAVQARFMKRFPKQTKELHDDSESSTCVLWVESESACKALVEVVWSMLFRTS